jgi:hypothetical protein
MLAPASATSHAALQRSTENGARLACEHIILNDSELNEVLSNFIVMINYFMVTAYCLLKWLSLDRLRIPLSFDSRIFIW